MSHDKCWKKAFRSLQIWKLSGGGYPQTPPTRLLLLALAIMPPYLPPFPRYKKRSYGPVCTPPNSAQLTNSELIKPTESRKKGLDCYCLYSHTCYKIPFFFLSCTFQFMMVIIACSRLQESNACTEAVKTDVRNMIMSVSIFPYDLLFATSLLS